MNNLKVLTDVNTILENFRFFSFLLPFPFNEDCLPYSKLHGTTERRDEWRRKNEKSRQSVPSSSLSHHITLIIFSETNFTGIIFQQANPSPQTSFVHETHRACASARSGHKIYVGKRIANPTKW